METPASSLGTLAVDYAILLARKTQIEGIVREVELSYDGELDAINEAIAQIRPLALDEMARAGDKTKELAGLQLQRKTVTKWVIDDEPELLYSLAKLDRLRDVMTVSFDWNKVREMIEKEGLLINGYGPTKTDQFAVKPLHLPEVTAEAAAGVAARWIDYLEKQMEAIAAEGEALEAIPEVVASDSPEDLGF